MSIFERLFANLMGGRMGHGGGGGKHGYNQGRGSKHGGYNPSGNSQPQNNFSNSSKTCAKCNITNTADARFCQQCGNSLAESVCLACQQPLALGAKFCNRCGKSQV